MVSPSTLALIINEAHGIKSTACKRSNLMQESSNIIRFMDSNGRTIPLRKDRIIL